MDTASKQSFMNYECAPDRRSTPKAAWGHAGAVRGNGVFLHARRH
jgi:hypothetical protein